MNRRIHHLEIGDIDAIEVGKKALLALIVLSSLTPLLFVDLAEPSPALIVTKLLAKTGSLVGTSLLVWQFLLGFRGVVSRVLVDLVWVVGLHKQLGKAAGLLILLHPVFITVYYLLKTGRNIFLITSTDPFSLFVLIGIVAFLILIILVITSVPLRARLSKGWWYFVHLLSYFMLPLVLVHSFAIGMTVRRTPLWYGWAGLSAIVAAFYIFRILFRFGAFSKPYRIATVHQSADRVTEIRMQPVSGKTVKPKLGQFIYVNLYSPIRGARPYTVSDYNAKTGELSITAKAQGIVSTSLQSVTPNQAIGIDGPYGVFTWRALQSGRPLVMIAGGIGITPFRRLIKLVEEKGTPPALLFFACQRRSDIVYRDELNACSKVKVVVVLNDEPEYQGPKGVVTLELMQQHLMQDLSAYEYLLCGPPIMISKLQDALTGAGITQDRIHHELFNW